MTTIDELREEIKVLEQEVIAMEKELEELGRKGTEDGLSADKRKHIAREVAFIRTIIPLKKRQITAIKEQIAARKRIMAADKIIEARKGEQVCNISGTFLRQKSLTGAIASLSSVLLLSHGCENSR
jgi:hypothetical protein